MKVARKPIYAQEDCFSAAERGVSVRIGRYRNTVEVRVLIDGREHEYECTLAELAEKLKGGQ